MLQRPSYVSSSSISAYRAATVRAVWSSKMPLANAPALLNLLDGPVDVDPAFHVVWSRFRMMCRYLAYCPEEEPRIFRMLDLISGRAQGHGPVHLLLISAAELGFAWDGNEHGWVRVSLPPLRMMTGPVLHLRSAILDDGCPLSMIFIVALYVPWSLPDVKPQLYADYLKCSAERLRALLVLLPCMSGRLVRTYRLVSVFFSAPPRRFVGL